MGTVYALPAGAEGVDDVESVPHADAVRPSESPCPPRACTTSGSRSRPVGSRARRGGSTVGCRRGARAAPDPRAAPLVGPSQARPFRGASEDRRAARLRPRGGPRAGRRPLRVQGCGGRARRRECSAPRLRRIARGAERGRRGAAEIAMKNGVDSMTLWLDSPRFLVELDRTRVRSRDEVGIPIVSLGTSRAAAARPLAVPAVDTWRGPSMQVGSAATPRSRSRTACGPPRSSSSLVPARGRCGGEAPRSPRRAPASSSRRAARPTSPRAATRPRSTRPGRRRGVPAAAPGDRGPRRDRRRAPCAGPPPGRGGSARRPLGGLRLADGVGTLTSVWRGARRLVVVSASGLTSDPVDVGGRESLRLTMRRGGLLLCAPEELLPPDLGALTVQREDGLFLYGRWEAEPRAAQHVHGAIPVDTRLAGGPLPRGDLRVPRASRRRRPSGRHCHREGRPHHAPRDAAAVKPHTRRLMRKSRRALRSLERRGTHRGFFASCSGSP